MGTDLRLACTEIFRALAIVGPDSLRLRDQHYRCDPDRLVTALMAAVYTEFYCNLPPLPGLFPDYSAPIGRNAPDGVRELAMARWGMPSSQKAQLDAAGYLNRVQSSRQNGAGQGANTFSKLDSGKNSASNTLITYGGVRPCATLGFS